MSSHRLRRLGLCASVVALVVAWVPVGIAQEGGPLNIGRSAEVLRAVIETEHFQVRYRPGSRAGAGADRAAREAERDYARIVDRLELDGLVDDRHPFHLFLYDDTDELLALTETEGNAGFSAGRESHVPYDNDQTRLHELVHIVLAAMKPTGDEARNMFFVEGIANAVLEHVHGVPVHAVAAYERRRESLPPLATLVGERDFYAYLRRHPQFNGYDVGASFMLHLLDAYGAKQVMRYYHGVSMAKALRASLEDVEASWHAHLDEYTLRPEVAILLGQRRGDGGSFGVLDGAPAVAPSPEDPSGPALDDELLGQPDDWTGVLDQLVLEETDTQWRRDEASVTATNSSGSDWSIRDVTAATDQPVLLRTRLTTGPSCWGIQLRFGKPIQAMMLGQGSFLYRDDQAGVAFTDAYVLGPRQTVTLHVRLQGGRADFWIDGEHVLTAEVPSVSATLGLGIVGGSATFHELAVRDLDVDDG